MPSKDSLQDVFPAQGALLLRFESKFVRFRGFGVTLTYDEYVEFHGDDHDGDEFAKDAVREDVRSDAEWLGVVLPPEVAAEVESEVLNIGVVDDLWDPEFRRYEVEPADIILRRFPVLVGLARRDRRLVPPRVGPARRPLGRVPRSRRVLVRRTASSRAGPDDPSGSSSRLVRPGDPGAGVRVPAFTRGPPPDLTEGADE